MNYYREFIKNSEKISFKKELFTSGYLSKKILEQDFFDFEKAREYASDLKSHVVENLDLYLNEFENVFSKNGGKISWADSTSDAINEIERILKINEVKTILKNESRIFEEIELNKKLEKGKYQIIDIESEQSKNKFLNADAGISDVNFLVSKIGGLVQLENSGNKRLSSTSSKIHIYVTSIENIIPSMDDLSIISNLYSIHSTGEKSNTYHTIITSPRKVGEIDGPERIYLFLLNNNRTEILSKTEQNNALKCIKCGACSKVCPIYQTIGHEAYNSIYSGPIGSVIMPFIKSEKEYGYLSYLCTNCGMCSKTCPVKIKIDRAIFQNKIDFNKQKILPKNKILKMEFQNFITLKRTKMDYLGGYSKNILFKLFYKRYFGKEKISPRFYKNSFSFLLKNNKRFY